MKKLIVLIVSVLCWSHQVSSQNVDNEDLLNLSLEDLMNVEIVTASKRVERLFDSPLSASVITASQIKNSGATSIPEILRLAPGLIVREQTPGNFDVHIRGFDNVPPQSDFNESINSTTLVMINNRVVYNYFAGGTFWESLPIDINSIEKIEIIRGPSAALYGPNAVTGVIHIITKRPQIDGAHIRVAYQTGSYNTTEGFQSVEYRHDTFDMTLTTNFELRDRQSTEYYEHLRGIYLDGPEDLRGYFTGRPTENIDIRYPKPGLAAQKMGINSFINYNPSNDFSFAFSSGYQKSFVQKVFVETRRTPLTTNFSETHYFDAVTKYKEFSTQISYLTGNQDTRGSEGWAYNLNTLDIISEYNFVSGNFHLKPGLSYRLAHYNGQFLGGPQNIYSTAFFLRSEYTINDLRLILAARGDQYNHPNDPYFSFQSSASYKIDSDDLIRIVVSHAHRAPFILRTYLDKVIVAPGSQISNMGNKNLKLLQMMMYEVGYRRHVSVDMKFDIEAYYMKSGDYSGTADRIVPGGDSLLTILNRYENTKLKVNQIGLSAALEYILSQKTNLSLFGTIQKSEIKDFQPDLSAHPDSLLNFENKSTPHLYGGFALNYKPVSNWLLNLNGYIYSKQVFKHLTKDTTIPAKLILNSRIAYNFSQKATLFINIRNLLNEKSVEYAFSDRMGTVILGGLDLSL